MKIDLHTHSINGSGCSRQTIEQIVSDAREHGLDAVCLTDHNNMRGKAEAERISAETGFPIFVGMEANNTDGDFLIFGNVNPAGYPTEIAYREVRPLIDFDGCALIPAHCYRGGGPHSNMPATILEFKDDFAAIEAYSVNMNDSDSRNAVSLAGKTGLPIVGCSDSHHPGTAGLNYTEFEDDINSVEELVAALKSGRFRAVRADYAWKAQQE